MEPTHAFCIVLFFKSSPEDFLKINFTETGRGRERWTGKKKKERERDRQTDRH